MITREEYLKALQIVKLYRQQCLKDINLSDDVVTYIDPESLFREVASGRLYKALRDSEFFVWIDDYTVGEIASLVSNYGISEIRKYRGFGGKLSLELESIIFNIRNQAELESSKTKTKKPVESFEQRVTRISAQLDKNPRYQIKPKRKS